MKALTLAQPWPLAFTVGKRLENRTWEPPRSMIGEWIALHGGKVPTGQRLEDCLDDLEWIENASGQRMKNKKMFEGVFAVARLDYVLIPKQMILHRDDRDQIHWRAGDDQYAWVFGRVIFVPQPVPCRGALKLWDLPREVHTAVLEAIRPQREALSRGK